MSQTKTVEMSAAQKELSRRIIRHIKSVLTSHDDGTMGFAAIDTKGNIVHIQFRKDSLDGVLSVYTKSQTKYKELREYMNQEVKE